MKVWMKKLTEEKTYEEKIINFTHSCAHFDSLQKNRFKQILQKNSSQQIPKPLVLEVLST